MSAANRHQGIELIEAQYDRVVLRRFGKELLDLRFCAVYQTAADIGGLDKHEVKARLFREFLGEEGLTASRRAVQQHAVRRGDTILLREFFILDHEDHFLRHIVLQFLHTGYVGKTVSAAATDLYRQIVIAF